MFEKLLATLPYNPGLADQVAFYGRRMREESVIRRTGLIFIVLAFVVQFFAVLSPPTPAAAAAPSANDLIYGGIDSPPAGVTPRQEAANKCNANVRGFGKIMEYYGIDCPVLANATPTTIGEHDYGNELFVMGNNDYNMPGEQAVPINPGNPVFWRYLHGWNFGGKPIKVLSFTAQGRQFFLMFDCGNLISNGIPPKYTPPGSGSISPAQAADNPQAKINPAKPLTPATPTPTPTYAPTPVPVPVTPIPPTPCPYDSSITADNTSCKPCVESNSQTDAAACVTIHKTASDITAGIADANNKTVNPDDVITYTLYAKNNGKATVKNYLFEENLDDVLVYADVTDLHGGTIDQGHKVSWPATFIEPGKTATVQVTVKVKNPVPQTPVTPNDPNHYDLIMTNVYGNAVNINLPGSPAKTVETAAATLPNTGPGTNLFIGGLIVVAAGYFFSRSRLLAQESTIALKESTSGV